MKDNSKETTKLRDHQNDYETIQTSQETFEV